MPETDFGNGPKILTATSCMGASTLTLCKATQTRLLVSRPHSDENGCGREVIIHYSLFRVKKLLTNIIIKESTKITHYERGTTQIQQKTRVAVTSVSFEQVGLFRGN